MYILHLSDIHFGRNYARYSIKDCFDLKSEILDELIKCVSNLKELAPEHIIVTGDIAWHGKKDEYDEALLWFRKLLQATNLTGKDITFCVGNHDVNRDYCSAALLDESDIEEIDSIYDYKNIHKMEAPVFEYDRFCEQLGVEPYKYPYNGRWEYSYSIGYKDVKFPSRSVIRVTAFNTALLSAVSQYPDDRMWIGQRQVKDLIHYGIIPDENIKYTIALFHHAERFLHPNEISEYNGRVATLNLLRKNVDLILCGHTETGGKPVRIQQKGGGELLTAGATYYSDTHINTFSLICIADNCRDFAFKPFAYVNGWNEYPADLPMEKEPLISMPKEIADIRKGELITYGDLPSYTFPLDRMTVSSEGTKIYIDNYKEVLRKLDIRCEGDVITKNANLSITLAPKMHGNAEATLAREKYFYYISQSLLHMNKNGICFSILDGNKNVIFSGKASNCKTHNAQDANITSIMLLEKLIRIEKEFGIIFELPTDMFQKDADQIEFLCTLLDNKRAVIDKSISECSCFCGLDDLKNYYKESTKLNQFWLISKQHFYCKLFGKEIDLGERVMLLGKYKLDAADINYKIETYKSGDTRKVSFRACDETQRVTMIYWSEEELDFHDSDNYVVIPALSTELGVLYTKQDF